jgi:imidazolonepropionase-like amidohydrolase
LLLCLSALAACGGRQQATDRPSTPAAECVALAAEAPAAGWPIRQATPVLIAGATVMTAAGTQFAPGFVLLVDGRIASVGAQRPETPAGTRVIDATGLWVTPGLIDTHSHLGVYPSPSTHGHDDGNEATDPTTPQVAAQDSVWPQDPGFERAARGGVTAMQILPGSANLVGGRGFVLKNHRGARVAEQLRFAGAPDTLKMACGENPKRVYGNQGRMPSTRMGNIATMRQMWIDARDYRREWDSYHDKLVAWCGGGEQGDKPEAPGRDLGKETLAEVLRGHILPQIHCYQSDDMLNQIQIADEMGFSIRGFHHAVDAYKIRDVLAARQISVSTWPDWWGFKIEAWDTINEAAALMTRSGVRAVLKSDSPITNQRLNQEVGKALAAGREAGIEVTDDEALRWVTANAAWTLGIDAQTGTLEAGKMADVVVWDRQPFSVYASAVRVFIDGIEEVGPDAAQGPWSDFEAERSFDFGGDR